MVEKNVDVIRLCLWSHACCMFIVQQVNDFVRDKFTDKDNNIPFIAEIMAGGCVSSRSPTSCSMCSQINSRKLEMQRRLHVSFKGSSIMEN